MKVAEKDKAVHGLLQEEYRRCLEVLASLLKEADRYPRGSLNVRKKKYKDKEYAYHYLVAREKGRVINRHIPKGELQVLQQQLDQRDKCRKEIQAYNKRLAYLEKILQVSRRRRKEK
jgi:hypothetical protein